MSLHDEFLEILRVLVSPPSSAEPSLPDSRVEDHASPEGAAQRSEKKNGGRARP